LARLLGRAASTYQRPQASLRRRVEAKRRPAPSSFRFFRNVAERTRASTRRRQRRHSADYPALRFSNPSSILDRSFHV
jgi:hypothetical protein